MITVGIDSGSSTTKAVLLEDSKQLAYTIIPTEFDFVKASEKAYFDVISQSDVQEGDIGHVYSTGYGRKNIGLAERSISEITAHALGTSYLFPEIKGIIDIGGQDNKVISVEHGKVLDFLMNDKCAAGTGKFLEYTARALNIDINDLGDLWFMSKEPALITSMCTVFAESEVISLRTQGILKEDIAAGLIKSIANKVAIMAKKINLHNSHGPIAFVGGVAKNRGIHAALEQEISTTLLIPPEPQITGALGAALYES
ncbi:acyl-CoA dehydratase activase [Methanosalsum natronophilum]|uniref:acyl-CoA dehydratase activase n=1 Tax=Methanosalsum natronophilum TaxID=768733 RepID=UPI00216A8095|nr:acyl-CoA dehydratase activase [Methanosalsum natronophilum]MCS3923627.1 putative CoA-substrate-specific enzyme activase [Methanosalsum natronophilum]